MTIVDHRVLVNTPPEVAWQLLGDLEALPKWHVNCTTTSMLTTQHEGVGVRRRNTMRGGPDVVEEIISWYPNLGFEYRIVDGPRYRSNRGRIRLQPIPEGTVIQWTFEYQLGGFLAGLRDVFHRRRLNDEMARNLKRFKQLAESSGVRMDAATIERVAMRAAPSAAERAAIGEAANRERLQHIRTPEEAPLLPAEPTLDRMPPPPISIEPEPIPLDDDLPPAIAGLTEPPLTDEDTRPRPALDAPSEPAPAPEVDLLEMDTPPAWSEPEAESPTPDPAPESLILVQADEADSEADTITEAPTEPYREPAPTPPSTPRVTAEPEPISDESEPETAITAPVVQEPPISEPAPTPPSTSKIPAEPEALTADLNPEASLLDREISPIGPSIWEVFGIERPGEGETPPPTSEPPAAPIGTAPLAAEEVPSPPPAGKRSPRRHPAIRARAFERAQGLRLRLNKALAHRLHHRIKKAGP